MRKLWFALAVVLLLLAVPAFNLVGSRPRGTSLTTWGRDQAQLQPVAAMLEQDCANCHSTEGILPLYATLPLARGLIHEDRARGLGAFDLVSELLPAGQEAISEAVLAKIEHQVDLHTMPPGRYRAMHWDSHLNDAQREIVRNWIAAVRAEHYAPAGIAPELQANVIHPLPVSVEVDGRKASLGEVLYHDPRLSGDGTVSCASCHDLQKGGADGERFSRGIGGRRGALNAPTTFNSGFQRSQFWDGRAATLEEQAAGPPLNPIEMGATWPEILAKLERDPEMVHVFSEIYRDGITAGNVTDAIAEFERTLVTPNSRFDRWLRGEEAALTEAEQRGHEHFLRLGCQTCHMGKLLGGQSFEPMGRHADYFAARGDVERPDFGRYNVTRLPEDRYRFKVPTLRNVAQTAPYFHDGTAATLGQAVDVMSRVQLGRTLPQREVDEIVQFLGSLTGEYRGKLVQ